MKFFTPSSSESKQGILSAALFGVVSGIILLNILPMGSRNILFLLAFPLVGIFFLLVIIDVRIALVCLLLSRASMDYFLGLTRVDMGGQDIGIGAGINLFVILVAMLLSLRNPKAFFETALSRRWILFLIFCGVAVVYSPVRTRGARFFLNLTSYYLMFMMPIFLISGSEDKKFWLKVLLLASIPPVCYANIDLLMGGTQYEGAGMRIRGPFPHPNILAFYLVFSIALVFYFLKTHLFDLKWIVNKGLYIYLLDLFVLLAATKTRNAYLACLVFFLVYGLLKERRYLFYVMAAFLIALSVSSVSERILNVTRSVDINDTEGLNSFTWRLRLWKSSLSFIRDTPFFGRGLASFIYYSERISGIEGNMAAHNTYIEILFETGILGILAYIAIYFNLLRNLFKRIRKSLPNLRTEYILLFGYVLGWAMVSLGDNMLYYLAVNWYTWFFIGVILASQEKFGDQKFSTPGYLLKDDER